MALVLALLGVGVVLARLPQVPKETSKSLDTIVLWFSLPGLVLTLVPGLDLDTRTLVPILVAWGTLAVLAVLVLGLSRVAGWSRAQTGTLLLVVPLANTSFLGIPAVEALQGADHIPYAIIHDQLGSFLALATYGTFIAARYGSGASPDFGATLGRILTFPPFVALVVAFVARSVALPDLVFDVAGRAADTLVPLTMLAVGMRLRIPQRLADLGPLVAGLTLRMAVAPAVVIGLMAVFGFSGIAWETSALEVAMPPMVTAAVVATAAGLDEDLASALVGVGVLAAMLSLPAWAGVIQAVVG